MGALTAAFQITNAAGWQDDYDVTVYQLGWRLGGKGASGRGDHGRIEEHGLHILLGFYENAFGVLKQCYDELGRPPGTPLATWQDAFKGHDYIVLMEQLNAGWTPWAMTFPPNTDEPGTGGVLPTPWAIIEMILGWLKQLFIDSPRLPDQQKDLDDARAAAARQDDQGVVANLVAVHDWLHALLTDLNDVDWRRDFVTVDLGLAAVKGMIADGVIWPPYDYFKLDTLDFRAWLSKYGAHDISVQSAYISGMYDLGFSLPGQVGAGTALNGILRLCWTYKGARHVDDAGRDGRHDLRAALPRAAEARRALRVLPARRQARAVRRQGEHRADHDRPAGDGERRRTTRSCRSRICRAGRASRSTTSSSRATRWRHRARTSRTGGPRGPTRRRRRCCRSAPTSTSSSSAARSRCFRTSPRI